MREQSWRLVSPSWQDAKNQTTTFAYDSRNRLISTTDPLGIVETYEYDGNDNLLTRVTPKAETICFEYNAVNELIKKTLPGAQGGEKRGRESFLDTTVSGLVQEPPCPAARALLLETLPTMF